MTGAFAAKTELRRLRWIEEHHGLGGHRAVLGGAEGEDIESGAPRDCRRRTAKADDRVGEARAVHVEGQAVAARHGTQRRNLLGTVNGTGFGLLGDADDGRLDVMDDSGAGNPLREHLRRQLAVLAWTGDELG